MKIIPLSLKFSINIFRSSRAKMTLNIWTDVRLNGVVDFERAKNKENVHARTGRDIASNLNDNKHANCID